MCGILTIYKREGLLRNDVTSAIESLNIIKHRGPDGEGLVLVNSINRTYEVILTDETPKGISGKRLEEIDFDVKYDLLLGHRRLSIFDLSINGHQPLFYDNLSIIFNGEIYNFIELREELKKENYKFSTGTDTEVILAAYRYWGKGCFSRFNGMWAIVIYDFISGELLVSNDRFGVKPLFYYTENGDFMLMSEPKQIMAFPEKIQGINTNVVDVFMDLGYLFYNDETFFKGVNRFPSASYYKFSLDKQDASFRTGPLRFYNITEKPLKETSEEEVIKRFREILADAVKLRLRSDVEWGISLSGGLDSTSIAFVAKDVLQHHNFTTFSVISEKGSVADESYFINLANKELESKNIQINPLDDFDRDTFLAQIYQIGSPVGDTSFFAQYRIKKAIKENGVTVLLSGQGGDEILAGYHHHFFKYITSLLSKGKIIKSFREVRKWSDLKGWKKSAAFKAAIGDFYLTQKTRLGKADFPFAFQKGIYSTNRLRDYLQYDLSMLQLPYFLQADDSFSMAYAVETRNPFLDYRLVDFVFSLPDKYKIRNGWQKWLLREAISEMPHEIRYRTDKKGFSTPFQTYIRNNEELLISLASVCDKRFPEYSKKALFKRAALGAWIEIFDNKH